MQVSVSVWLLGHELPKRHASLHPDQLSITVLPAASKLKMSCRWWHESAGSCSANAKLTRAQLCVAIQATAGLTLTC